MEKKRINEKKDLDKVALRLAKWARREYGRSKYRGTRSAIYMIEETHEGREGFLQNYYPELSTRETMSVVRKAVELLEKEKV